MNKLLYNAKDNRYFYIGYDGYNQSPRESFDHMSHFLTWEGKQASPDKNPFPTFEDFLKNFDVPMTGNLSVDLDNLMDEMSDRGYICLPVWKYEHGGTCYRAAEGNPFPDAGYDSGLVGVIYEEVLEHENPEDIKIALKSEVYEEYTAWIEGNIFVLNEVTLDGELEEGIWEIYNQDLDDDVFAHTLNEFCNADIESMDDLEEVGYEYDYMPIDIDPDLVDDEMEYEDVEYRELTLAERIAAHQEYLEEMAQDDINRDDDYDR